MISADTSTIKIGYIEEVTEGTTPGTPVFTPLRVTSESFKPSYMDEESEEITPTGNIADIVRVGAMVEGAIGFELIYGNLDDLLESLLRGAWSTDVLVNGVADTSYTFQKYVKVDGSSNDFWMLFTGCSVDKFSLNMESRKRITGSMDFRGMVPSASATITGSWGSDNTNAVMDASNDFTLDAFMGVSPLPSISSLTLDITPNTREKPEVGSLYSAGTGRGQVVVSGKVTAYIENKDLLDEAIAGNFGALTITLGSEAAKGYTISIPKVKLTNVEPVAGGNNQDMMFTADWRAKYDSGIGGTIQITRAVTP